MSIVGNDNLAVVTLAKSILKLPANIRGVLFDIDGTLVDTDDLHFRAFQEIFNELGFLVQGQPIDRHFYDTQIWYNLAYIYIYIYMHMFIYYVCVFIYFVVILLIAACY